MQPAKSAKAKAQAPLALAAVAFGTGVWIAAYLHRPAGPWAVAAALLAVCAIAAVMNGNVRLGYLAVALALVGCGAFTRLWTPPPRIVQLPQQFVQREEVEIVGHVVNDGSLRAGSEPRERFDLETEVIQDGEVKFTEPVGIRATLFVKHAEGDQDEQGERQAALPQLAYGARI